MNPSRRDFLKIAGISTISLIAPTIVSTACAGEKLNGPGAKTSRALPANALQGKRWAMAVDAAKCRAGCVDCLTACHQVHNVPAFGNPKDEIKWIWQEPFAAVFPDMSHPHLPEAIRSKPLPTLCNHCADPPCVRVCPTKATFQRADGIVMMDYHRCIGCRFCMAGCPYGARSMNYREPRPFISAVNPDFPTRTKGVVEKCNFCEERLAAGLLPACVTACKEKALIFGDLEDPRSEIRLLLGKRFNLRRKAQLGTQPQIYYIV
jgi:molybdopterin-containing oxidoreductase family iron-sulfur binding subunit